MNTLKKISDLFIIKYGMSLSLTDMEQCKKSDNDSINFVSRTDYNNGISAFVKKIEDIIPNESNTISVALSGSSVLASFYQPEPYYSGYHIGVLTPIKKMTQIEMIFYTIYIKSNRYRYSFGRQANKTLKDILVPSEMPTDFRTISLNKIHVPSSQRLVNKDIELRIEDWKWFEINSIFKLEKCKCNNATKLLDNGNDIYYIGAKKNDNGIMQRVKYVEGLISKGNCITFIGDGQGSVGYTTYQPIDFIGSTTLTCGYNNNLNKYNALFLISILDLERFRYSFGRKYGKAQLLKNKIKLPAKDGYPDWEFMENFIKSLTYSSTL